MKKLTAAALAAVMIAALLITGAAATEDAAYCFAAEDFAGSETVDGIYLAAVPSSAVAEIRLGKRQLCSGDVIPSAQLGELALYAEPTAATDATIVFRTISGGHLAQPTELRIPLLQKKNEPPTAEDVKLETYRNMEISGAFKATDPESGALTFTIVKKPSRGEVTVCDNGTFLYTPRKNKVGTDTFRYTATDEKGAVSDEATVTVNILKPSDKTRYIDMQGDPDEFAATWLRECGVFRGETVAGNPCFSPDKSVTRGEFLAMTMALLNSQPTANALSSGFADEADAPAWMQPYIATALQSGMIAGVTSERGLIFRPTASITKAEAAVLLQNTLHLPSAPETAVFASDCVPAWADSSMRALSCAGITIEPTRSADDLTRRDAAVLLRQVAEYLEAHKDAPLFS
ncbi:MAG: S-layer homology domain-containing protein [Oscillospiraceae bacterium]|nr:S-layer homology domain-containing protein [Oscillospiraceae bacterium]